MTAMRMPNGQYVDIPPGTPPDVIERVKAQYRRAAPVVASVQPGTLPGSLAPGATDAYNSAPKGPATSSEKLTAAYKANLDGKGGLMDVPILGSALKALEAMTHEASFHADDQLEAAAEAALPLSGVQSDGTLNWNERRKALLEGIKEHRAAAAAEDPLSVGAGSLFGMIKAPLGVFGKGGMLAKEGVGAAADVAARAASKAGLPYAVQGGIAAARGAARGIGAKVAPMFEGAIGQGALQGAGQGGLTSLVDTGDPNVALRGALGGATGGAIGGAVLGKVLPGVMGAFTDRSSKAAERVAYEKIAAMLGRAKGETGVMTPASATAELAASHAAGTPAVLGDLSHELTGYRGELARRTVLPSSGDAANAAAERLGSAGDRFEEQIRKTIDPATGQDALALKGDISAARKAQAEIDYKPGGAMDEHLTPKPELVKVLNNPPSYLANAIKQAREVVSNDPALQKWGRSVIVGGKHMEMPTLRSFDAIKKAMDDQIEAGIKHLPDGSKISTDPARIASLQLRALKSMVAESNPEYGAILSRQRDAYEMLDSVNAGKDFIKSMRASPREVLTKLKAVGAQRPEEVRTGLVDALLGMRNTSTSPIKVLRGWEKNPDQRAVLEHVMGGPENFTTFSKFMRRELRSMQGDEAVLRGSRHPVLDDFAEHGESSDVRRTLGEVVRGQAYGGLTGGASAAVRAVDRLKSGMGPEAQETTLRLLGGDGRGLERGVKAAKAFRDARKAAALQRARAAGRIGGGLAASLNGTGE